MDRADAGPARRARARTLGVETFKTYNDGQNVYSTAARARVRRRRPAGRRSRPTATGVPEVATAIVKLNQMAATVPVDKPWTAPNAVEWDGQTVETWKRANTTSRRAGAPARPRHQVGVRGRAARRLVAVTLFYIAAAGNETNAGHVRAAASTSAGGAQESRFVGGSQRVSLRGRRGARQARAARPRRCGASCSRAAACASRPTRTRVSAQARRSSRCRRRSRAQIDFSPALPPLSAQLTQRFPMGTVYQGRWRSTTRRSGATRG